MDPDPGKAKMVLREKKAVLWIRTGFNADPAYYLNADPDSAYYLNADLDSDPGSKTNADPGGSGSGSDF